MEPAPLHHRITTAPSNGTAYWMKSGDGLRLRIAAWPVAEGCRGTVLIFPGRGDYIELFGHAISALVQADLAVFAIDWRGHGLSDCLTGNPKTGHIEDFADYQRDVEAMVSAAKELDLPQPWYLLAHSMGACIALRSLIEGLDVQAAALSAPMFGIRMAFYERLVAQPLTRAMAALGKGHVYAPGFNDSSYVFRHAFESNTLTNCLEEYERWIMQGTEVPELHTGGPSMGWLNAALIETRSLSKHASPDIPCITLCGDQDVTVDVRAIAGRLDRWPKGKFEIVSGAKHELFLEKPEIRGLVQDKIIKFFNDNC
jgi:lysophospholipase